MNVSQKFISNSGYCPVCDSHVTFFSEHEWLRDNYVCNNCFSIPRERALMYCIDKFYSNWKQLYIHESSPATRGTSAKLKKNCENYLGTHYYSNFAKGEIHDSGWRNEDLENQTFPDESFDLVITQDVMEHIFDPAKAFLEIARTLKPGGSHIFTVPLLMKEKPSSVRAVKAPNGDLIYLQNPEYHGNPIDPNGSLVTMYWGYDISEFIFRHSGLYTTIIYLDNLECGIRAEYIEVLLSRKLA